MCVMASIAAELLMCDAMRAALKAVPHRWLQLVFQTNIALPPAAVDAWMGGAAALASTGVRSAVPCEWRRQAVRLEGYPPGVRRALVLLRGTERRGWEGHYGAKFAAPALRVLPPGAVARG